MIQQVGMIRSFATKWMAPGEGRNGIEIMAQVGTLVGALMIDGNAPEDTPRHFLVPCCDARFSGGKFRDEPFVVNGSRNGVMRQKVDRGVVFVRERATGAA